MNILCVKLNSDFKGEGQFGHYNMYRQDFEECVFIDVYPNFNIHNGSGRIIQFQWNKFLRRIKRYLWMKKKGKKRINKFWKEERKIALRTNTDLPERIIDIISSYSS
jgi:hypothetical protein